MKSVLVYSVGICYASACSSKTPEETAEVLNDSNPTGVKPWTYAAEDFADGTPNGVACPDHPATHKHYLFTC